MLHAQRGGHLRRDRAALADLTHEHDVVRRDHVLRSRDDLAKRGEGRVRDVVARVFSVFAHVDDLQLATRDTLAHFASTQSAEGFGRRLMLLGHMLFRPVGCEAQDSNARP